MLLLNNLELFNFVQGVVVCADTGIVDLFKANDDGVADAALVNGDDLAGLTEPVRFGAEDADLRCSIR